MRVELHFQTFLVSYDNKIELVTGMLKQVSSSNKAGVDVAFETNGTNNNNNSNNNNNNNNHNNSGDDETTLFVGDLPALPGNSMSADLNGLFDIFGIIDDIQVKTIRTPKQSFSYAFVRFMDRDSACQAFQQLHDNLMLGPYKLRLGWACRNKSLHIGNSKYTSFLYLLTIYYLL